MKDIQSVLEAAIELAKENHEGIVANYIPELASVREDLTSVVVQFVDGKQVMAGDELEQKFTLQSVAKVALLIGMLEEYGPEHVFSWVKEEPSGDDFASVARLDQFGPVPSNPMLNAGAISLCSHIPGSKEQQLAWLETWMERLFGSKLSVNPSVFASERRTGDRNRSLAYLMKSNRVIEGDVTEILENYFWLCSYEATVQQTAYLPMLIANGGRAVDGVEIFSKETSKYTTAIMASCGLYNESGAHLTHIGMPGKSGVSGFIIAVLPGKLGIAVMSPKINRKGTSIRGEIILTKLSQELGWHFALI